MQPYIRLIKFTWDSIKPYRWYLLAIFFVSFIWSFEATLWPYIVRLVIDDLALFETNRIDVWVSLKWPIILGASLWIGTEVVATGQGFLLAWMVPKLQEEVRLKLFDHVQRHSPSYFNKNFAGSLTNKIADMTYEVNVIWDQLISIIVPFVGAFSLSIFFFYKIKPLFAWILTGWMVIHVIISVLFSKRCAKYENIHGEKRSELYGKIIDSLTNNVSVNLFYRFSHELKVIAGYQREERNANTKAGRVSNWMRFFLGLLTLLVGGLWINWLIIYSWVHGSLTTGEVVQIFYTTSNITALVWGVSATIPQFFESLGMATQALTILDTPSDVENIEGAKPLIYKKGEIVFDDVSFHYGKNKIFQNKNISIGGGEKVGIVGFSGAGKTTFVNLILRFFPLESGKITIDGQDISKVTLQSLRELVTLVPQDPILFHRTLRENIRYGRLNATDVEVEEAAKEAHSDLFIKKLPLGYESLVGERGTAISSGERQRIAISRAILAKSPILILDEATSSLDSVTERYIQEAFEKVMEGKTAIVIAHRLSTLLKMDRILVFENGKIVEEGSHKELLSLGGHYANMWKVQTDGFIT